MKMTNKQIKQIIKEELDKILEDKGEEEKDAAHTTRGAQRYTKSGMHLTLKWNRARGKYIIYYRLTNSREESILDEFDRILCNDSFENI